MTKLNIFIVAQLVIVNFIGLIALRYARSPPFAISFVYFYYGLFISHVSLLGFWAGMGLSAWWKRLLGFFAGVLGLWFTSSIVMLGLGSTELWVFMFIIAVVVSLTSVFKRRFGVQLERISEEAKNNPAPKMQFTIRGLFMVTFCAALLLLIARVNRDSQGMENMSMIFFRYLVFILVTLIATLLSMWAALSLHSPVLPMVIAIVVVLSMGLVLIWSFAVDINNAIRFEIFILSHFGWTLATLLVLRSYGYRLTSKEPTHLTKTV